jgi:hypothetical protein
MGCNVRADPGMAGSQHGMDDRRRFRFAVRGRKRHGAAIPIGNLIRRSQRQRPSRDHGCQRRLRRLAGGVRNGGNLDGCQADFAPIVEQEASTVGDLDYTPFGRCIGATVKQRIVSVGGKRHTGHDERNNHWGPPRHTSTKRAE